MPRDPRAAGLAVATATFLVLPYAFNYDMTVIGLAAAILLHRAPEEAAVHRVSAALTLLLPVIVVFANHLAMPLAPPILLLFFGALLARQHGAFPVALSPERQPA
jgi:hypothetical protein